MNATEKYYTDSEFLDILNELYGTVDVCGMTMDAGRVLKEMDPVAFDCGNNDYFDGNPRYECGECSEVFTDEDEANECCKPEDK